MQSQVSQTEGLNDLSAGVDSANEGIENVNRRIEDISHEVQQLCILVSRTRLFEDPTIDVTSGRQSMENIRRCAYYAHRTISVASETIDARSTVSGFTLESGFGELLGSDSDSSVIKWLSTLESVPESAVDETPKVMTTDPSPLFDAGLSDTGATTSRYLTASRLVEDNHAADSINLPKKLVPRRPIPGPSCPFFSNPRGKPTTPEVASRPKGTPQRMIENILKLAVEDFDKGLFDDAGRGFDAAMMGCVRSYPQGYTWDSSLVLMVAHSYVKNPRASAEKVKERLGKSIDLLLRLHKIGIQKGDWIDDVLHSVAYAYYQKQDYDQALGYCRQAIEEREKLNDTGRGKEFDRFLLYHSEYLRYLISKGQGDEWEACVAIEQIPEAIRQGMLPTQLFLTLDCHDMQYILIQALSPWSGIQRFELTSQMSPSWFRLLGPLYRPGIDRVVTLMVDKRNISYAMAHPRIPISGTGYRESIVPRLTFRDKVLPLLMMRGAGFDIGTPLHNGDGFSSLHLASLGHPNVARVLLQSGHPTDTAGTFWAPLHVASLSGCPSTVEALLEHGADPNRMSATGATPLHMASISECPDINSLFSKNEPSADEHKTLHDVLGTLTKITPPDGCDLPNGSGILPTPISTISVIEILLNGGAKLNASDLCGSTPLMLASCYSSVQTVKILLDQGSDIEATDKAGSTPLLLASLYNSIDTVRLLLDRGSDIYARDNAGSTPLSLASRCATIDAVRLLLDRGGDIHARDNAGSTPLLLASRNARVETVGLLLDRGSDIDAKDNHGLTSLSLASCHADVKTVKLLLDRGSDIHARDNAGSTPLLLASRYATVDIVRLLLDRGSNIKAKDNKGQTVLSMATARDGNDPSRNKMVQLLRGWRAPQGRFFVKQKRLTFRDAG
jgi:ankyrin repeat protein/tetratricopeptide (TPR) repeat protein